MINDEPDFRKFACELNSYLLDKGYKMLSGTNSRHYYLGDKKFFVIDYDDMQVHFHRGFFSLWELMDFYTECPGSYKPDLGYVKECADQILIQHKQETVNKKIKDMRNDF